MRYATYDLTTGRVHRITSTSEGFYVMSDAETWNDETHYMVGGVPTARPVTPGGNQTMPADGVARVVAAALPANTMVYVNGTYRGMTSGDLTFTPSEPAVVEFRLDAPFPYRNANFTVTVTEVGP